jgi:hypothetical protein
MALGQQQDLPRPPGIFGAIRPAIGSPRQLHKLRIVKVIVSLMDTIIVYKWLLRSTGAVTGLFGSTTSVLTTHSIGGLLRPIGNALGWWRFAQ